MVDKLISDLGAVTRANLAADTLAEIQRNGQTTTENARFDDLRHYFALGASLPFLQDAGVYIGPSNSAVASFTTIALSASRLYMVPVTLARARAITTLVAVVQTLSAGAARLGLWNADRDTKKPLTLIAEGAATINTGSTGVKTDTISVGTVEAGDYWLGINANAGCTVRAINTAILGIKPNGTNIDIVSGIYRDVAYGAFGDESASTWTLSSTAHPALGMR